MSAAGPRGAPRGQGRPVRDPAAPAVPVRRAGRVPPVRARGATARGPRGHVRHVRQPRARTPWSGHRPQVRLSRPGGRGRPRAGPNRREGGRRLLEGDWGGNTVAEWLDTCAPVVMAEHAETTWPETLVLDSTRFLVTNSWTGDTSVAFNVLGAYGYPAPGQGRPRVWALAAYHQATALE